VRDEGGATPLHWAALSGHLRLVQFCLAQGFGAGGVLSMCADGQINLKRAVRAADPQNDRGGSPDGSGGAHGRHRHMRIHGHASSSPTGPLDATFAPEISDVSLAGSRLYLEKLGYNHKFRRAISGPPLHWAVASGRASVCRALHERGARLEAVDTDGRSAMHVAVQHKCVDVAWWLLDAGADPERPDGAGLAPVEGGGAGRYAAWFADALHEWRRETGGDTGAAALQLAWGREAAAAAHTVHARSTDFLAGFESSPRQNRVLSPRHDLDTHAKRGQWGSPDAGRTPAFKRSPSVFTGETARVDATIVARMRDDQHRERQRNRDADDHRGDRGFENDPSQHRAVAAARAVGSVPSPSRAAATASHPRASSPIQHNRSPVLAGADSAILAEAAMLRQLAEENARLRAENGALRAVSREPFDRSPPHGHGPFADMHRRPPHSPDNVQMLQHPHQHQHQHQHQHHRTIHGFGTAHGGSPPALDQQHQFRGSPGMSPHHPHHPLHHHQGSPMAPAHQGSPAHIGSPHHYPHRDPHQGSPMSGGFSPFPRGEERGQSVPRQYF
jgi:hypothetical protein